MVHSCPERDFTNKNTVLPKRPERMGDQTEIGSQAAVY
jgi:hypothetical protein